MKIFSGELIVKNWCTEKNSRSAETEVSLMDGQNRFDIKLNRCVNFDPHLKYRVDITEISGWSKWAPVRSGHYLWRAAPDKTEVEVLVEIRDVYSSSDNGVKTEKVLMASPLCDLKFRPVGEYGGEWCFKYPMGKEPWFKGPPTKPGHYKYRTNPNDSGSDYRVNWTFSGLQAELWATPITSGIHYSVKDLKGEWLLVQEEKGEASSAWSKEPPAKPGLYRVRAGGCEFEKHRVWQMGNFMAIGPADRPMPTMSVYPSDAEWLLVEEEGAAN